MNGTLETELNVFFFYESFDNPAPDRPLTIVRARACIWGGCLNHGSALTWHYCTKFVTVDVDWYSENLSLLCSFC